ncbi:MAG: SCO family protein [Candidatus Eremiobacteraeota bacterium]|nr:SCO family protein [Candidatus Eremiobacteraeota bacterium]
MIALLTVALAAVVPVHGIVLASLPDRTAVVRTDTVVGMLPSQTRRYRLSPPQHFSSGTTIDALLDISTQPPTLEGAVAAAAFAPGLPDRARTVPITIGGALPAAVLVDQNERRLNLASAFRGKTLLLSFVFTRCPDRTLCPAISGKFAYLQPRLDPRRFALAEITLDPQYDSPAVLRRYGAAYGARPERWTLLTGTGSTIERVLDEFGVSSMRVSTSNFLHDDRLFLATPSGKIADVVETGGWDPQSVLAQARAVSGLSSNPFERFKLALVADVIALCGGSESTGIVLLELSLFTIVTAIALAALWLVARILWGKRLSS